MNPQRRANRRGHAVLLAQNLENPCGVYHMAHSGLLRRRRPSTFSIQPLQTGRRRVFIMTTIQTQRPTLVYVACFYPDLTAITGLLLSRHSQQKLASKLQCERNATKRAVSSRRKPRRIFFTAEPRLS